MRPLPSFPLSTVCSPSAALGQIRFRKVNVLSSAFEYVDASGLPAEPVSKEPKASETPVASSIEHGDRALGGPGTAPSAALATVVLVPASSVSPGALPLLPHQRAVGACAR